MDVSFFCIMLTFACLFFSDFLNYKEVIKVAKGEFPSSNLVYYCLINIFFSFTLFKQR